MELEKLIDQRCDSKELLERFRNSFIFPLTIKYHQPGYPMRCTKAVSVQAVYFSHASEGSSAFVKKITLMAKDGVYDFKSWCTFFNICHVCFGFLWGLKYIILIWWVIGVVSFEGEILFFLKPLYFFRWCLSRMFFKPYLFIFSSLEFFIEKMTIQSFKSSKS